MRRPLALVPLVVLAVAVPAAAVTWSPSVQVNDASSSQQDRPAIAFGPDGAAYLAWDDYRGGSHADIYFSRRDPATGAWSANERVNADATNRTQWRPAIAVDGADNVYAAWQDDRDGKKSPDTNVYFARRAAATGAWSANVRVNDDRRGSPPQTEPRIAVTPTGDAVTVWIDFRANQWNVYSARLAAGSLTWSANLRVSDQGTSRKYAPDIAISPDGSAYAVWEDDRGRLPEIWSATLAPGAIAWSANQRVSEASTSARYGARVGVDAAGDLLVAFVDDRAPSGEVRLARRLAGNATWDASRGLSDADAVPVTLALGVVGSGDAFVVWQDARGASYDVWGVEYAFASDSGGTPQLVSDDLGSSAQMRPAVALNAAAAAVAWRDDRVPGGDVRSAFGAR